MKQLLFILIIFCAFSANAQVKAPKGFDVGGTIIDANEIKSLNGITGNIKDTLDSKVRTSAVSSSLDEFYNKTQSNTRFINEDGDTITGTILVPTPAAGTNTTQAANTEFVQKASTLVGKLKAAGVTTVLGVPFGWTSTYYSGVSGFTHAMLDGAVDYVMLDMITETTTITSISYQVATGGNFTPDNNNKVALCKYDGTNFIKVAESSNDGTIFNTTDSFKTINLTTPYVAFAGYYAVAIIYNCSGTATTTPTLYSSGTVNGANVALYYPTNFKTISRMTGQTDIPSSVAVSSLIGTSNVPMIILK